MKQLFGQLFRIHFHNIIELFLQFFWKFLQHQNIHSPSTRPNTKERGVMLYDNDCGIVCKSGATIALRTHTQTLVMNRKCTHMCEMVIRLTFTRSGLHGKYNSNSLAYAGISMHEKRNFFLGEKLHFVTFENIGI